MILAFIGIGNVGFALANALERKGHTIIVAHDNLESKTVKEALSKNSNFTSDTLQNAIDRAELVFLATPFKMNASILQPLDFNNKTLVDCTNPVGPGISHGLESDISGAEKVQEWAPSASVVKAFTIYGFENFENTAYPNYNVKPVLLIAGNNAASKLELKTLINDVGFAMKDTGNLDQALHLEHMTLLWVKMVRRDGHHPNFVWALLER